MGEKIKRMKKAQEITLILLDKNDNALGHPNYDRWNKLPWYKRLFGFFFYCYKRKFIDLEGFKVKSTDGLGGLKADDFTILQDGKEIEIDNFEDLGNGSYIVEPKFLKENSEQSR